MAVFTRTRDSSEWFCFSATTFQPVYSPCFSEAKVKFSKELQLHSVKEKLKGDHQ